MSCTKEAAGENNNNAHDGNQRHCLYLCARVHLYIHRGADYKRVYARISFSQQKHTRLMCYTLAANAHLITR